MVRREARSTRRSTCRGDAPRNVDDGTDDESPLGRSNGRRVFPSYAPNGGATRLVYNFTHHAVHVSGRGARRVASACDVDDGRASPFNIILNLTRAHTSRVPSNNICAASFSFFRIKHASGKIETEHATVRAFVTTTVPFERGDNDEPAHHMISTVRRVART